MIVKLYDRAKHALFGAPKPPERPEEPLQRFREDGVLVEVLEPDVFRFSTETEEGPLAATLSPKLGRIHTFQMWGSSPMLGELEFEKGKTLPSGFMQADFSFVDLGVSALERRGIKVAEPSGILEKTLQEVREHAEVVTPPGGLHPKDFTTGQTLVELYEAEVNHSPPYLWQLEIFQVGEVEVTDSSWGPRYTVEKLNRVHAIFDQDGQIVERGLFPEIWRAGGLSPVTEDIGNRRNWRCRRLDPEIHRGLVDQLDYAMGKSAPDVGLEALLDEVKSDPHFQKLELQDNDVRARAAYRFLKSITKDEAGWAKNCEDLSYFLGLGGELALTFEMVEEQQRLQQTGLSLEDARSAVLRGKIPGDAPPESNIDLVHHSDVVQVGDYYLARVD